MSLEACRSVSVKCIWEILVQKDIDNGRTKNLSTIDVRIRTRQPFYFQDDNLRAGHSADVDEIA